MHSRCLPTCINSPRARMRRQLSCDLEQLYKQSRSSKISERVAELVIPRILPELLYDQQNSKVSKDIPR